MALRVISMAPILRTTSKKSGNESRDRRSGCIVHLFNLGSVFSVVSSLIWLICVVLMQKAADCRHMQRQTGKLRRTSWLSKHRKRKSKPAPRSLLQLTKPRELHSKPSQQQTLMIAHLMIHPLMMTHLPQTLNRIFHGLTVSPKCYLVLDSPLLHHYMVSF